MIGWLDCSAGVAGDMLLGALVDAGVPLEVLQSAVDRVAPVPVRLRAGRVTRGGLAAVQVQVDAPAQSVRRSWPDVQALLGDSPATAVFRRLAEAEGHVHGVPPEEVHFHEVGALDALADVAGAVAGFAHLGLSELHCSPVALGSGHTRSEHGRLPVPGPAVLALLTGRPVVAGTGDYEMATPTGAALVATLADRFGGLPPMRPVRTGHGAGSLDPAGTANVVRLVLGEPSTPEASTVLLETNVDDLDPRLWPGVLSELMAAGALDVWLTPVLMKKGRPAHVLSVLATDVSLPGLRSLVFTRTSTIGVREVPVGRTVLDRTEGHVEVEGSRIRVKVAAFGGRVVNVSVEHDDVLATALALELPAKVVLARATALAQTLLG